MQLVPLRKNVFLSIGDAAETNLKAAIDRTASASTGVAGAPFDLNIDVGQVLDYIQKVQPNPFTEAMAQTASQFSSNDSIIGTSRVVPHGVIARFTIQEGVLRAIGAAAKAGQGGAAARRQDLAKPVE